MGSTKKLSMSFLNSVLHNGVGRYVCQLQRLTLQFCKKHQFSRGMRDFIEEDVVDFAHRNPQIVLYVTPHTKYQSPKIIAEYLNGKVNSVDVAKKEREEIAEIVDLLRTQSGQEILKTVKPWRSQSPSTQGIWHPFMHKPQELNLETFPSDKATFRGPYRPYEVLKNLSPELQEELAQLKARSLEAAQKERLEADS